MKQILLLSATLLIGTSINAQCVLQPNCTNIVNLTCTDISNQNINGSPCFTGSGIVPNSYNINNAAYYSFDGGSLDSTIYMYQNINLGYNQKVFNKSGKLLVYGNLSMSGSDTFSCSNNTETIIAHLIPNNGNNTFVLEGNATLKVGPDANSLVQYYVGDTIHHPSGNPSNNVRVVGCTNNIPLGITIVEFKLYHNTLFWKVIGDDQVIVEYESVSKPWTAYRKMDKMVNYLEIKESGNYRLKAGNTYSEIIPYELHDLSNSNPTKIIYFYNNKWYSTRPEVDIVGQKIIQ